MKAQRGKGNEYTRTSNSERSAEARGSAVSRMIDGLKQVLATWVFHPPLGPSANLAPALSG
jgi:hypothetical protein